MTLRVGTRKSRLAVTQTREVISLLGEEVEVVGIDTKGDLIKDRPFTSIEGKGFFVKEVDNAVLDGTVDFAVHSMKDLPADLAQGLVQAGVPKRKPPFDCLISSFSGIDHLPQNAKVGTSSLRRQSEILRLRSDLEVVDLRGNLDTRLKKLDGGECDAIVVAEAGLVRLGYTEFKRLGIDEMIPASGQGALSLVCRDDDDVVINKLKKVSDRDSEIVTEAEKTFLGRLGGGCSVPAGASASVNSENVSIKGFIGAANGSISLRSSIKGKRSEGLKLAKDLADDLLKMGGSEILSDLRGD